MKKFHFFIIILPLLLLYACNNNKKHTLFEKIPSSHSNITFNNKIVENDSINPLDAVNVYNGGGVGIGDFNNDGLQDIYLGGNMVPGKLYLNKGNFKFEDVTKKAGVAGLGRWERGISVIDINNDGLMDIYISNTISTDSTKRTNILYVNQGIDKDGIPHFKDMAKEYGLDIKVQSTMASFFDYDNDGDLDMYLTVNEASNNNDPSVFLERNNRNLRPSYGRLYRNDWDSTLKHPVFHDVSAQAGIAYTGYGHAATICDINNDGWKDIYISDDFLSNDILYINNHDGTFTNRVKEYFKHTSFNSMGQDVVDINNDGLPDIVELDMNPPDNYRKKMMLASNNYITYQNFDNFRFQYQYVRNTLQINQGPVTLQNDSIGPPAFSDIGFMSGISQTDWSWCPLVMDFDNDSYRDIIITNGFPRDVSDHDFQAYREEKTGLVSKMDLLKKIPQVKIHNYAFHNNGNLTFSDSTSSWGLDEPTFSNGAAYADFDNDGAMDMVINDIDGEALLYRNTSRDRDTTDTHYLQIKFKGGEKNINGTGAVATIYYNHGKLQTYENNPYRGYISTDEDIAHFGLGKTTMVDSVVIKWYNGKAQTIKNVKANQLIKVNIADANEPVSYSHPAVDTTALFNNVTGPPGIDYRHRDFDFNDFNIQSILPHKFTEYCPALASGDIDGNGLDDLVIGGNSFNAAQVFLQQKDGSFIQKSVYPSKQNLMDNYKDEGILLFDANGDGKPDLYISSGGYQNAPGSKYYQDRLYINDGKGNFKLDSLALPQNHTSKLCVRAFDYNHDGKMDLFVSGRVDPWNYPKAVSSFIFRNDTKNGVVKFTDVTDKVAPDLKNIGMVTDALFTDFDNDGQTDLILVGEWMPITFLKNENGIFKKVNTGIENKLGWWNSIVAGDFRHTGRMDYIVGNLGLNTIFNVSDSFPMYITSSDYDNNGTYDAIISLYLPDKNGGVKKEFPLFSRDDMIKQLGSLRNKFPDYKSYANATMQDVLSPDQMKASLRLKANYLKSCFLRNDGNGKFTMIPLPKEAQVSVLNGMVVGDFDGDGNLDVAINGNDYGTEVSVGRYDALNGLVLKGDGKGNFKPKSILQSGIYIPGNGKALVKLLDNKGNLMVAASQNRDVLKVFKLRRKINHIPILSDDMYAMITYKNGTIQKQEFYYGSSFLSQSARFLIVNSNMKSVEITNNSGKRRMVDFH
ncbi:MAG TPA: VCBS repeat-containing protein [Hanamia sp.]